MPDVDHEAGRIRYMPMVATEEQRRLIEKSALYGIGQVVLIAVNVGDLNNPVKGLDGLGPIGKEVNPVKIVAIDFFGEESVVTIISPVINRAIEELSNGQALKEGE